MRSRHGKMVLGWILTLTAFVFQGDVNALIAGRDAESEALACEKQGKFKEAAAWRLLAARAYRELIIPFEIESVRAFSQVGDKNKAEICARRAEVLYPEKVRDDLWLYEQDLQKAGGEKLRVAVEQEATEMMIKLAPLPLSVPSRMTGIEDEEKKRNWHVAADYQELAGRIYLLVTVPFFEKESDAAKDPKTYRRLQVESLKYLKLARENFVAAAQNYARAAQTSAQKADVQSRDRSAFYSRKAAETQQEAEALLPLINLKTETQKSWQ
jgi:hypothetical protein